MRVGETFAVRFSGGEILLLRPSLRCAMKLADRPGGFPQIIRDLQEGSLTAICDLIADHATIPLLPHRVFDSGIDAFRAPLMAYVLACAGIDMEAEDSPHQGTAVTFPEHLAQLYRYGTGWLGWTPEETLDATPAEIIEAVKGRAEMMRVIFGGKEPGEEPAQPADLGQKFRAMFSGFGTKIERATE